MRKAGQLRALWQEVQNALDEGPEPRNHSNLVSRGRFSADEWDSTAIHMANPAKTPY